ALEHRVRLDLHHHVEVAGGAAVDAGLAAARQADAVTVVDPRGDFHRQRLVLLDAAAAAAGGAGVGDHLAGAVALGAGLLDRETPLLHAHLALALAGGAGGGLGAGLGAAALAGAAFLEGGHADAGLGAARRVFQRDLEVVAQVGAAVDAGALAAAAEDVAE